MRTLFGRRLTSAPAEVKFGVAERPKTKHVAAERPLRDRPRMRTLFGRRLTSASAEVKFAQPNGRRQDSRPRSGPMRGGRA